MKPQTLKLLACPRCHGPLTLQVESPRLPAGETVEDGSLCCGYEHTLPGFKRSFKGPRQAVSAPVNLVPPAMTEVELREVWKGWMYCLEFRKP